MRLKRFITCVLTSLLLLSVVTIPVLAATYSASFTVSETEDNSYDMLPVIVDIDNESLVDAGIITEEGLDTRVVSGTTELPHMLLGDKTLFTLPVEGSSQYPLNYTMGDDPLDAFYVITGYGGRVTVADDDDLELDNDFEIEISDAFIDTSMGGTKNIVYKQDAFRLFTGDVAGEVTATITGVTADNFETGADGQSLIYGTTSWSAMTFTTTSAYTLDAIQIKVYKAAGSVQWVICSIRNTTGGAPQNAAGEIGSGSIDSATFTTNANGEWYTIDIAENPLLASGTKYAIVLHKTASEPNDAYWKQDGSGPPYGGGSRYTSGDSGSTWNPDLTKDMYFRTVPIEPTVDTDVTVVNVTSDEHDIRVSADGTNFELSIDGAVAGDYYNTVLLDGASVPDNDYDWLIMDNSTTPFMFYMGRYDHMVSDVPIVRYQPNDIVVNTSYDGTADAGGDTDTIIDAELTQANDYWNWALVTITDTTDDLAPIGETSVCELFEAGTDEVTLETALTAGVDAGDTYTIEFGTLVDRQDGDEDGRITWGVNPLGIDALIGPLLPTESSTAPEVTVGEGSSFVPETGEDEMLTTGIEGENLPFYGLIHSLLTEYEGLGGPHIAMAYFWKLVVMVLGWAFGTAVMLATRQVIFGIFGYLLGFGIPAYAMGGVLDSWIPIVYGIGALCLAGLLWKWTSSSIG